MNVLSLEDGCRDYINIFLGTSADDSWLFERLCDTEDSYSIIVPGSRGAVFLKFFTDLADVKEGFSIDYRVTLEGG